jgi:hypothetical protein
LYIFKFLKFGERKRKTFSQTQCYLLNIPGVDEISVVVEDCVVVDSVFLVAVEGEVWKFTNER